MKIGIRNIHKQKQLLKRFLERIVNDDKKPKTFSSSDEILQRLIRRSEQIAHYLQILQQFTKNQRRDLLLDELERSQQDLTQQLRDYRRQASKEVLNTYSQYSAEDEDKPAIDTPETTYDIINKTLELNEAIRAESQYLADKEDADHIHEAFQNLNEMVENKLREMSMNSQTVQDI